MYFDTTNNKFVEKKVQVLRSSASTAFKSLLIKDRNLQAQSLWI
jgi:hypothetical protein